MASMVRKELKRWYQVPFTFRLSEQAAKTKRCPREPRRVVSCASCGSVKILGSARGVNKTRTVFYCDQDCSGIELATRVQADIARPARILARDKKNRAKSEAIRAAKNRLKNIKACGLCLAPTTRRQFCSDDCWNISKRIQYFIIYVSTKNPQVFSLRESRLR